MLCARAELEGLCGLDHCVPELVEDGFVDEDALEGDADLAVLVSKVMERRSNVPAQS